MSVSPRPMLWGVVLVGGRSSRMGRDKATLPHPAGGTFLDQAIRRLRKLPCPVAVSGAATVPAAWADQSSVVALPDPIVEGSPGPQSKGPVIGIVAALRYAAATGAIGIVVTPVDMPNLTGDDLQGLVAAFNEPPGADIADRREPLVGTVDGVHREPLVAIYPVAVLDSLEQLATSGDRSLNRWLERQPHRLHRLSPASSPNINTPDEYANVNALRVIDELAASLRSVGTMALPLSESVGRVLAADITADRDSPAADVSAMDGYAFRSSDLVRGAELRVVGESVPGSPPPAAPAPGETVRIFTGAVVPAGCDAVVRREDVRESAERIAIAADGDCPASDHIRRRGENSAAGATILSAGSVLNAGCVAAAANFGAATIEVARPVRVQTIVTGDELLGVAEAVQPWQLRDSNGPTLHALLSSHPWIERLPPQHASDRLEALTGTIAAALQTADALILTGGVSMGDYDFVPAAVRAAGGRQLFHKLPLRPGKPIFGAVGPAGQLILGLPGNPVSAAVGTVRFGIPLLRRMAHCDPWMPPRPRIALEDPPPKTLPLHWFRLVRLTDRGTAELVPSRGSGDLVSLAQSSGFIEQPPSTSGPGPWVYWPWS